MGKKVILIVEDEANIREVYSEVLKTDYDVIESSDGEDGLVKAMEGKWDLMLLDIMLPKRDGLEILSRIKKDVILKGKPVVLLTNLGRDSIIKEGYNLGASGYLVKSEINPGDVAATVRRILEEVQNDQISGSV
ncbi:hypothetical protein A2716_00315 [candidate division WWE3 bacterium RIFCSPHIGHO2_01_FULL_40_23]|uniref:Response regulatory domain-containing protein n=1 Tax=candidate division WWE3 bacterium RIFCSPLOWO2_01_FULL_41_18 TaxID=1802625 RepID=A0A1F4VES8_UNCKA|nr:MAG: hypothetical protein A2716_00315 [candidate division WWE3 bacterium RIFCSPHIGHO2_01_FULL_40_23]OGC55440.1 MAG: hypothetical protein A3A78_00585 [candidate division WWE3 bacterium RIFCSPLOWO2_01_FULL_41_18]